MPFENFDHVLYMQIRIANLYRKAHKIPPPQPIEFWENLKGGPVYVRA
jgi:hypothetical protein